MPMTKHLLLLLMAVVPLMMAEDDAYCELDESYFFSVKAICRYTNIQINEPLRLKNQTKNEIVKVELVLATGGVQRNMLQYFPTTSKLSISDSYITSFSLQSYITALNVTNSTFPKVSSDILEGCKQLTTITFMSNDGLKFENGAFKHLKSLRELRILNQSLPRIERGLFEGLENLDSLVLISNGIRQIDEDAFLDLPNLTGLFLDANPIESLSIKTSSLTKPFRMSLFNTNLKNLNFDVMISIKTLTSIGLSGQLLKNPNTTELVTKVPSLRLVGIISKEHLCPEVVQVVEELKKNGIAIMDVFIEQIPDINNFIKPSACSMHLA